MALAPHCTRVPPPFNRYEVLLVAAPSGKIAFAQPIARRWLRQFFAGAPERAMLPRRLREWVPATVSGGARPWLTAHRGGAVLFVRLARHQPENQHVLWLRVSQEQPSIGARPAHKLTLREAQVLRWISDGKSNQQIADILGVALGTVRKHVENIFNKLGVDNRTAAAGIFLVENPPPSPLSEPKIAAAAARRPKRLH